MRVHHKLLWGGMLGAIGACSGDEAPDGTIDGNGGANAGNGGAPVVGGGAGGTTPFGTGGSFIWTEGDASCGPRTCEELGWQCGYTFDQCGNVIDCSAEGLTCADNEVCQGGIDGPTQCVAGGPPCELCNAVPDCAADQPTRLTGRVITPGRDNDDTGNQVGVPNAIVYILRGGVGELPAVESGIPSGGTSCDRCEEQELGPVLDGAVTDASGNFTIEGNVPVGQQFVLVVKAGKFRRAMVHDPLPADTAACATTAVAADLTRLPRAMDDGLAVNIPRVAISTGQIDAMECVFEKMGIDHAEFGNPGADGSAEPRIHLYRGGPTDVGSPIGRGAYLDANTPHAGALYGDLARLQQYDILVSDCEGLDWDGGDSFGERNLDGDKLREYVNRGGRMFASHLSFSWLHQNGSTEYSADDPIATGLGPAATWSTSLNNTDSGDAKVSIDSDNASPRIDNFADWMINEGIIEDAEDTFSISEPRSQNTDLGEHSEEFVDGVTGNTRVQQFSFNTPYGAPQEAACGRVAYSGFHVSVGGGSSPFANSVFPNHCSGSLTNQEKILLYMLFDLGACVGAEPPAVPTCTPLTQETECENRCGYTPDGCGNLLDCGPCSPSIPQ